MQVSAHFFMRRSLASCHGSLSDCDDCVPGTRAQSFYRGRAQLQRRLHRHRAGGPGRPGLRAPPVPDPGPACAQDLAQALSRSPMWRGMNTLPPGRKQDPGPGFDWAAAFRKQPGLATPPVPFGPITSLAFAALKGAVASERQTRYFSLCIVHIFFHSATTRPRKDNPPPAPASAEGLWSPSQHPQGLHAGCSTRAPGA